MEDYLPCLFVIFAAIEIIILPYKLRFYFITNKLIDANQLICYKT